MLFPISTCVCNDRWPGPDKSGYLSFPQASTASGKLHNSILCLYSPSQGFVKLHVHLVHLYSRPPPKDNITSSLVGLGTHLPAQPYCYIVFALAATSTTTNTYLTFRHNVQEEATAMRVMNTSARRSNRSTVPPSSYQRRSYLLTSGERC